MVESHERGIFSVVGTATSGKWLDTITVSSCLDGKSQIRRKIMPFQEVQ